MSVIGIDADGVAERESDHFEKCPVCNRWFDMRDLNQASEHFHDLSEAGFEQRSGPPPRAETAH